MSTVLVTGAICFVISGYGIPMSCPSLLMASDCGWKIRAFAGGSLLFWCVCLAYSVTYLVTK